MILNLILIWFEISDSDFSFSDVIVYFYKNGNNSQLFFSVVLAHLLFSILEGCTKNHPGR